MTVLQPGSAADVGAVLQQAAARGRVIRMGGMFSKNRYGGPLNAPDVLVSTAALNRVLAYEPADLTLSVGAGMLWSGLSELLAANRQMIPLDPPFAEEGTVGGALACNLSGPRRRRYGSARDLVIGMEFVTVFGRVVKTGGMVVKNVAGLDMAKLMIGSLGTLAVITSVNFKLQPMPEAAGTALMRTADLREAFTLRDGLLRGSVQPVALDLLSPRAAWRLGLGESQWVLAAQVSGSEALLKRFRALDSGAEWLEGGPETHLWRQVREFPRQYAKDYPSSAVVRVSSGLSEMESQLREAPPMVVSRAGTGVSYLYFPEPGPAFDWVEAASGRAVKAVVESGPPESKESRSLWPTPGSGFAMMDKVKQMFDPERLLNRGRMYGRL
jgi:glycolate oxidase FAD binding subunit